MTNPETTRPPTAVAASVRLSWRKNEGGGQDHALFAGDIRIGRVWFGGLDPILKPQRIWSYQISAIPNIEKSGFATVEAARDELLSAAMMALAREDGANAE